MQKKSISKRYYVLHNTLFHSLCLAGLLWQVTKVSVDFFSYEVMKDINIIVPEEVREEEKVFFICINRYILDMDQYRRIIATKDFERRYNESKTFTRYRKQNKTPPLWVVTQEIFSAEERIETIPNVIFQVLGSFKSSKFFIGNRNCFQEGETFFFMQKSDIGFFEIYLSGKPLPYFYENRLFKISYLESIQEIDINYYSYSITRMEKPYQDKCFNYEKTKKAAIAECIHAMFPGNQFYSDYDLFDENNHAYQNQTYRYIHFSKAKKCCEKYDHSACDETIYLNQINMQRKDDETVYNKTDFHISAAKNYTSPSFIMKSKARINLIDFITYIMGALGAWIGFSFLLINPVPLIFKIRDNAISDPEVTPSDSNQDGILNMNRLDSDQMKSRILNIECKLRTNDQRLGEIVLDVSQKMSVFGQKMSAQEQQISTHGQKLDRILREITALKTSK